LLRRPTRPLRARLIALLAASLIIASLPGCSDGEERDGLDAGPLLDGGTILDASLATTESDAAPWLYRPDHVLAVEVTVAPSDWDRIRVEGRTINQSFSGCKNTSFEYTFVPASVRIDGEPVARLGLRKKGYLGSISQVKPSLRLDFSEFDPGQTFHGQKDLTLNNSRSDGSLLHQCLAYQVFAAAGIPAPRCTFARVSTNGASLGTYVNVEPIKKPFLRRFYPSDDGNLYEGNSGADFRAGHLDWFEKKTNESNPDRSELERIRVALESSGPAMLQQLEPLLDLDQFLRYWAVETIVGHWDGYTGDLNNFFVYQEPTTQKLSFIPWGTDDSFSKTHSFLAAGQRPVATYAYARLPSRLYEYEPTRSRYYQALRYVLDSVWNESALLAEIDRMVALVGMDANFLELAALRNFVNTRRADIERELANPGVPWTLGERQLRTCTPEANTTVRATFSTTWGAPESVDAQARLEISIDGQPQQFSSVGSSAGNSLASLLIGAGPSLRLVGHRADGSTLTVQFGLGASPPRAPGEVTMHGFETFGLVLASGRGGAPGNLGYIGEGKLQFEQAATVRGAPIVGRFEGKFVQTRSTASQPSLDLSEVERR